MRSPESSLALIGWQTLGSAVSQLRDAVVEDGLGVVDQLPPDATPSPGKQVLKTQTSGAYACRKERDRLDGLLDRLTGGDVFPKYLTLLSALVEGPHMAWAKHQHLWNDYATLRQLITQAHDLCLRCKSTRKWDIVRRAQHTQQLAAVRGALERFGEHARLEEVRAAHAALEQHMHGSRRDATLGLIANHGGKAAAAAGPAAAAAAQPDHFRDYHGLLTEAEAAAKRCRQLGVIGIAGAGKTAVVRRVFDRLRGRFAGCSVFLTVGRDPDPVALLQHAAAVLLPETALAFETAEEGLAELQRALTQQELHVLLVLDDVWRQEDIALLDFATQGATAHQDSRLLITTRHEPTLQHADGRPLLPDLSLVRVPTLCAADAEDLFRAHATPAPPLDTALAAGRDGDSPPYQAVAAACVPVPLVLQQVGAALRGRSGWLWGQVRLQLRDHSGVDTAEDVDATIAQQCKLSYDVLPPTLQECLLHWAAYPGGARVPEQELEALWAAQTPLPCEEAAPRAAMQMHELLQRRMITRDAGGLCFMHDVLQQIVCAEAAARAGFVYLRGAMAEADGGGGRRLRPGTVAPERAVSLTARAKSLWPRRRSDDDAAVLHASVPRGGTLSAVVPSGKAGSLRTLLHLRCGGEAALSEALACGCLRFLSLAGGAFAELPDAIGDLRMLEVLILRGCKQLPALPERLGDCGELRVFDAAACRALSALPARLTDLTALQQLSVRDCPRLDAPAALGGLTALRTLCAARCAGFEVLPHDVGDMQSLRVLDVSHCRGLKGLPEMRGAAQVEVLRLAGCSRLAVLPERLGELTAMRELDLSGCASLSALPDSIGDCSDLQTLTLRECTALEALPERLGNAARMQSLDISGCSALTQLPERLGGLSHLEVLDASRCGALAALPESVGDCAALRVLRLVDCTALTQLPARLGDLQRLQELDLEQCEGLTALPGSVGGMAELRVLSVKWCKAMISLPEEIGQLQALESLVLERCYALTALPEACCELAALTSLNLKWCRALAVLPPRLPELRNLEVLNLTWCKCLKALPADLGGMAGLHALVLERCYALTALPDSMCNIGGLTMLNLKWCKGLKALPVDLGGLTELRSLNVMQCGALAVGEVARAQRVVPSGCVVEADTSTLLPQE